MDAEVLDHRSPVRHDLDGQRVLVAVDGPDGADVELQVVGVLLPGGPHDAVPAVRVPERRLGRRPAALPAARDVVPVFPVALGEHRAYERESRPAPGVAVPDVAPVGLAGAGQIRRPLQQHLDVVLGKRQAVVAQHQPRLQDARGRAHHVPRGVLLRGSVGVGGSGAEVVADDAQAQLPPVTRVPALRKPDACGDQPLSRVEELVALRRRLPVRERDQVLLDAGPGVQRQHQAQVVAGESLPREDVRHELQVGVVHLQPRKPDPLRLGVHVEHVVPGDPDQFPDI